MLYNKGIFQEGEKYERNPMQEAWKKNRCSVLGGSIDVFGLGGVCADGSRGGSKTEEIDGEDLQFVIGYFKDDLHRRTIGI